MQFPLQIVFPGTVLAFMARVSNIIIHPAATWSEISREKIDGFTLFRGYILVLVAMQSVALVAGLLLSREFADGAIGTGIIVAVAVASFALALLFTFSFALIACWLARIFGDSFLEYPRALQLVAYASTPSWIGGALGLVPVVGSVISVIAGIYGLYLLCLGAPTMMRIPPSRILPFMAALVAAGVLLAILIGVVQLTIGGMGAQRLRA